jgi:hypothetical protein
VQSTQLKETIYIRHPKTPERVEPRNAFKIWLWKAKRVSYLDLG